VRNSLATETNDRDIKFEDYALHGVSEYWIIDPKKDECIEQYILRDESYESLVEVRSGVIASQIIASFEIPVCADILLSADNPFQNIAADPSHAARLIAALAECHTAFDAVHQP